MVSPTQAAFAEAEAELGALCDRDVSLRSLTTFRVGGPARLFVRAHTISEVTQALAVASRWDLPLLVVGQGSNLLVADAGFNGLVLQLAGEFDEIAIDGCSVTAGGGVKLPVLARKSVAAELTGLEWMVGVPGSVGGAVRMNAGGHGSDTAESLVSVTLITADDDGQIVVVERSADELGLAYRSSVLRQSDVVLFARFELELGDREAGEATLSEIVRWRRAHQPGGANCGSVFTNPPGDSAGRLIDSAGYRGLRIGTASVSDKHANFIQADDGASASDIWSLILEVRARIFHDYGVVLHPEVQVAGFSAVLPDLPLRFPSEGTSHADS